MAIIETNGDFATAGKQLLRGYFSQTLSSPNTLWGESGSDGGSYDRMVTLIDVSPGTGAFRFAHRAGVG